MKQYQGYLFDFDGTLFNTFHSLIGVYQEGFKAIGQTCTEKQTSEYMHFSLSDTAKLRNLSPIETRTFISKINEALDYPCYLKQIEIFPEAIPTIKALAKEGRKIGLVSGNTEKHIHLVLEEFSLSQYFQMVVGASPLRRGKPYGDPIFAALKDWPQTSSQDVVYIGDSLQDPVTAHNGGIAGVLLDRRGEYSGYSEAKISSLRDLLIND
jgi:phosphoglycolate phosphatase